VKAVNSKARYTHRTICRTEQRFGQNTVRFSILFNFSLHG